MFCYYNVDNNKIYIIQRAKIIMKLTNKKYITCT